MRELAREQPLILVVDQDQAVLDEMVAVLTSGGFACHCCLTAEAALAAGPLLLPDLIVADVHLAGHERRRGLRRVDATRIAGRRAGDVSFGGANSRHHPPPRRRPWDLLSSQAVRPGVLAELIEHALGCRENWPRGESEPAPPPRGVLTAVLAATILVREIFPADWRRSDGYTDRRTMDGQAMPLRAKAAWRSLRPRRPTRKSNPSSDGG